MVSDLVRDIKLPLGHSDLDLLDAIVKRTGIASAELPAWTIVKKSIDARKKPDIYFIYTISFAGHSRLSGVKALLDHNNIKPEHIQSENSRPVIAGLGPAGLFAALYLAMAGQRPLVLERGKPVEIRSLDVENFWQNGDLDPNSNVQFGEGGAGTFSDGKLTTGTRDPRGRFVLEELVLNGAPAEILYLSKPHVGTDKLRSVVKNMREKIIFHGGEIRFNTCLTDLAINNGRLSGVYVKNLENSTGAIKQKLEQKSYFIKTDKLILAPGHSARDTFEMLHKRGVIMQSKPFAVGARIEHAQGMVDFAQYGSSAGHHQLPPAEYKLATHLPGGRSVFTFCMCPGGEVIAASSEAGGIVTNGMSRQARDFPNANSAVLVNVTPEDFEGSDPLAGVRFQREWENKAFIEAGSRYMAPAQTVADFLGLSSSQLAGLRNKNDNMNLENFPPVRPSYRPGVHWSELACCLPAFVADGIKQALPLFNLKMQGFISEHSVLTGPESRSSSPVRIIRGSDCQSETSGIFPCGEGAGYAGGIMSAAVDGLRCAEASSTLK